MRWIAPPGPVAVAVNVSEVFASMETLPLRATVPTPLSMLTLVAFVVLHVSVAEAPGATLSG